MLQTANRPRFEYLEAFSRNLGWVSEWEQHALRTKRVAIAGLGGVGGVYLVTLARLGIGGFHIADLDCFDLPNINRQAGAFVSTLGRPKAKVMAEMARDINPELELAVFDAGVHDGNIDAFLDGVDLFVDGFDFFALDIRAKVFARCRERGIPALTAAPIGMGTCYIVFMPGGMSFEEYFRLGGLPPARQYVNLLLGVNPKGFHRSYLVDPFRVDLPRRRGPSTPIGVQLCAAVVGAEALKILLGRGRVRAAPWYHQFDTYVGKWKRGYLPFGNRNPIQAVKRRVAYRLFDRLSRDSWSTESTASPSEMHRILDLARWAPSGDNTQPWRFIQACDEKVTVRVAAAADNVYEYNGGEPTLLSTGFLLGAMRIAASRYGRSFFWRYRGLDSGDHVIAVDCRRAPEIVEDPLFPYLTVRSVRRGPYRRTPLTAEHKRALTEALGAGLDILWYESLAERWRITRLNTLATDIRLRIPEAYAVHRRILDWDHRFSEQGVPSGAIGLDPLTLKLMRWAMRDWRRIDRLNRLPGGTALARLQMDLVPGIRCAAHFAVVPKQPPSDVAAVLGIGEALGRFWLTATRLGLVMQPGLAPLCFADHARSGTRFSESPWAREQAGAVLTGLEELAPGARPVFMGRIGRSSTPVAAHRSARRPLSELLIGEA